MGQTLSHGVYLPAEGERNCYSGLASNWNLLDTALGDIAGKASATHTHGNITNDGKLATADRVVITDSTKSFTTSNVTATELGYLSGVTSAIQTQLNGKAADSDVVHKTGNETIGGNKTFSGTNKFYELLPSQNGGTLGNASLLHFNGFFEGVYVYDQIKVNGDRGAWIVPVWAGATSGIQILTADGIKPVQIGVATTDANNRTVLDTSKGYINFYTGTSGTDNSVAFYPVNTAISNLGTSTNKWKTLNGVNPGALSIPDGADSGADSSFTPDTTDWPKDGTAFQATMPIVGWLRITIKNVAGNYAFVRRGTAGANLPWQIFADPTFADFTEVTLNVPVTDATYTIRINSSGGFTAKVYPCLGNV